MINRFLYGILLKRQAHLSATLRSVCVLSDIRLPILFALLQISKNKCNSTLIVHKEFLFADEYGSESPVWWKLVKTIAVSFWYRLIVIDSFKQTSDKYVRGVLSSLVSATDDHLATYHKYPILWRQYKRLSDASEAIKQFIRDTQINEVFVYNGRFASTERISNLSKNSRFKVWFVEYGNIPFHFTIQDYPIHDYREKSRRVVSSFESGLYLPGLYNIVSFSSLQMSLLRQNRFSGNSEFDDSCDVAIILGSPHEFMHLSGSESSSNILSYCSLVLSKLDSSIKCIIKLHPNFANDPSSEILYSSLLAIAKSTSCDVSILKPGSCVSAIDLINKCRKLYIPTSSLSLVAEAMGKDPIVDSDSTFYGIIRFARSYSRDLRTRESVISLLNSYLYLIDQEPYHPFWLTLYKLLIPMDHSLVKRRILGLSG